MRAIYAGSFDPITFGHLDLIERSCSLFEYVFVLQSVNSKKSSMFTDLQKQEMLELACSHLKNLIIVPHKGAIVDFCEKTNINVMIRGLRSVTDFDYEMGLAQTNKVISSNVETLFMAAKPEHSFIASSFVRELINLKKFDMLKHYVPKNVERFILQNVKKA